jgi:hypothetical protein
VTLCRASGADAGDQEEGRAAAALGPAVEQPGAEGAVLAAARDAEQVQLQGRHVRRQAARGELALDGGDELPLESRLAGGLEREEALVRHAEHGRVAGAPARHGGEPRREGAGREAGGERAAGGKGQQGAAGRQGDRRHHGELGHQKLHNTARQAVGAAPSRSRPTPRRATKPVAIPQRRHGAAFRHSRR